MTSRQDMAGKPTSAPEISVCIANYNGGDLVLDCLASVYAQKGHFTMEVLVHDDLSTDDSLAAIRKQYPNVRIIASETNQGFCVSNNRMVTRSNGCYLLLLNNDAVLRPDSLQRLLAFASSGHQDCIVGLPQHEMHEARLVDRGYLTDPFLNPIPMFDPATHEVGVATGACLWIPRRTWDAVGGFPAWFESIAEDIYICMAARLLGHKVFVLDQPGFDHWIGKNLGGGKLVGGALHTTTRRRALSERNKTFAMLCCYPWPALLCIMPVHALLLLFESAFLVISGSGVSKVLRIYLRILPQVWALRRQLLELRRRLLVQRRIPFWQLFQFTQWIPQKLAMLMRHGLPKISE